MLFDVEARRYAPETSAQVCAADGMPLYPTIVGPRCPLCGAAITR
jgi:hypothetical protein